MEAESFEEGVWVVVSLSTDITDTAYVAVYDENGRMLGLAELDEEQRKAGEREIGIPCDGAEAAEVKFFVVDENGVPVFAASPCEI